MKRKRYQKDFPKKLYLFFTSYKDEGVPSFDKFARSIGATREDVESFRAKNEFERAYLECMEIRRDYLIDNALMKRFDSSFSKFLLEKEGFGEKLDEGGYEIRVSVEDDG